MVGQRGRRGLRRALGRLVFHQVAVPHCDPCATADEMGEPEDAPVGGFQRPPYPAGEAQRKGAPARDATARAGFTGTALWLSGQFVDCRCVLAQHLISSGLIQFERF